MRSVIGFFREEFNPHTGAWVYKHPDTEGLRQIYSKLKGKVGKTVPVYKNTEPPVTKSVSSLGYKNATSMKIYIASLGFHVVPHTLICEYGALDLEFDKDWFTITQKETGIQRTIFYKDWFSK